MFVVLLGLVFSKRTFLEYSPGVNDGATVGPEGVNCAGDSLFWEVKVGGRDVVAPTSEPPSHAFA
jgi:hypothetical protein